MSIIIMVYDYVQKGNNILNYIGKLNVTSRIIAWSHHGKTAYLRITGRQDSNASDKERGSNYNVQMQGMLVFVMARCVNFSD